MLELKNVSFSYQEHVALSNINLSFNESTCVCLLGSNGSSKSTLLNLLLGLNRWQAGEYLLLGKNAVDEKNQQLHSFARENVGFLMQNFSSDEKITVYDNLFYASKIYGLDKKTADKKINEALFLANLQSVAHKAVKRLSGGMRKRLELYRSFMHEPKLVLLDEPTESLDPKESKNFFDFLQDYKKNKKSLVIMSTQRAYEAENCDIVVMLHQGKIIASGEPSEFLSSLDFINFCFKSKDPLNMCRFFSVDKKIAQKESSEGLYCCLVKLNKNELEKLLNEKESWQEFITEFSIKKPDIYDAYELLIRTLST